MVEKFTDDPKIKEQYNDFIKQSVGSGQFFKDSLDWYLFKYVTPICDRAFLIVCIIILSSTLYIIKEINDAVFPLTSAQPIYIPARNNDNFLPRIVKLKPKPTETNYDPEIKTFDDSILKYLLINYVKDREEFDFSKGKIEDVNRKFNHIKATSKLREYKNFQSIMSRDNKNSPMQYFGKEARRTVKIKSIKFYRQQPQNLAQNILFFIISPIPTEVDVEFDANFSIIDDEGNLKNTNEQLLAKIRYEYQPVLLNNKQSSISFNVSQYALYRVKK